MSPHDDILLPPGTRLLHIGPHKTGTTTVQSAFFAARDRLADHGVAYPGHEPQPARAALAVTGQRHLIGEGKPQMRHWDNLVAATKAAGDKRAVVSSEFLCEADEAAIRKVITDLGGSRVHVVVTLRPLAKILPSQWQQWVQNGLRASYDKWLNMMLTKPKDHDRATRKFWARHDHAALVRRWSEVTGPDNLTVIVVDESQKDSLLRTFEALVGLEQGFLVAERSQTNRSLTLLETQLVQRINHVFRDQQWPEWTYARYLRRGAVLNMKAARMPAAGEPRIVTPQWALKKAAEIGADAAKTIEELGVRVIGDLSTLGTQPGDSSTSTPAEVPEYAVEAAVHAVAGAVRASGDLDPKEQRVEDRRVKHVRSRELLQVIFKRWGRAAYHALGSPRWARRFRP